MKLCYLLTSIYLLGLAIIAGPAYSSDLAADLTAASDRLMEWTGSQTGQRSTMKDDTSQLQNDVNLLYRNANHPMVTQFLKKKNAMVRLTQTCPGVCRRIVVIGLSSSDSGTRESAKRLLEMMTRPTESEKKDPQSYFNKTARVYSTYLKQYGAKNVELGSAELQRRLRVAYSNHLFSGEPFIVTKESAAGALRLRARAEAELSRLFEKPPTTEKDFVRRWFIEGERLASRSDYFSVMKEMGMSAAEIESSSQERVKRLARKSACVAWKYPPDPQEASINVDLVRALLPSYRRDNPLSFDELKRTLSELQMTPYAHSNLESAWPSLLARLARSSRSQPIQKAEFLELVSVGARLCRSDTVATNSQSRCLSSCNIAGCDTWEDINSNASLFLEEARRHFPTVEKWRPSRSEMEEYSLETKNRSADVEEAKQNLEKAKTSGSGAEELQRRHDYLKRAEERYRRVEIRLTDEAIEKCISGQSEAVGRGGTPTGRGIR